MFLDWLREDFAREMRSEIGILGPQQILRKKLLGSFITQAFSLFRINKEGPECLENSKVGFFPLK